jgi:Mg2+ and Co2+ transporter CorA
MAFSNVEVSALTGDPRVFAINAILMISAHWYTVLEYATTRITQIEWEVENPSFRLLPSTDGLDGCLHRLHRWRRILPIYQEMVEATLLNFIDTPHRDYVCLSPSPTGNEGLIEKTRPDFLKILSKIEKLQNRCHTIGNLVGTMISIEESKKAVQQNGNLTRLTYLACVFIPMSFMSSLFSMTKDLGDLGQTMRTYFAVAVPLTIICLAVTILLYSDRWIMSRNARVQGTS